MSQSVLPIFDDEPVAPAKPKSEPKKAAPNKVAEPTKKKPESKKVIEPAPAAPKEESNTEILVRTAYAVLQEAIKAHPMNYVPKLIWKNFPVTAGVAYYKKQTIGLSYRVLRTPEQIRETLLHEYAHLLAYSRHGQAAANHGPFWQQAMIDLGQRPTVRHQFEVDRNIPRQRVNYLCKKCGAVLSRPRRLSSNRKYLHAVCGGALKLQSIERVTPA